MKVNDEIGLRLTNIAVPFIVPQIPPSAPDRHDRRAYQITLRADC